MKPNYNLAFRFFWVSLVATVGVVLFGLVLLRLFGTPPPAIMAMIPTMIAAADNGVQYVRRLDQLLPGREAWRHSAVLLAVCFGLTFVIAVGSGAVGRMPTLAATQFLLILALFGAIYFCIIRFFLGFGARQEARKRDLL